MLPSKKKIGGNPTNKPFKKILPKPPVEEEDEGLTEDEVDTEDTESEVETPSYPKKKLVPKAKPKHVEEVDEDEAEDEGEEEPQPKKKASLLSKKGNKSKSALAAAFDSVPLSGSASDVPSGKHEAIIRQAVVQARDERGQSIRFNFELCEPEYGDANRLVKWYRVFDGEGQPVDWMINMLKNDLARMGVEIEGDELEDTLQEITDVNPGIMLKVSYAKGSDGNTYQRLAIDSECDNDVVQAYKDNVPL